MRLFKIGDKVIHAPTSTKGLVVDNNWGVGALIKWEDISETTYYSNDEAQEYLELYVSDMVNHPAHYTGHPTIEAIDVLEHVQDYRLGTAMKYIWRVAFGGKDNNRQDIEKSIWYLNRWLERNDAVSDA